MGVFDSIANVVTAPLRGATSVMKYAIIGILVLVGMFMLWVVVLKKDKFSQLSGLPLEGARVPKLTGNIII